jgi:hypothetical protein
MSPLQSFQEGRGLLLQFRSEADVLAPVEIVSLTKKATITALMLNA